MVSIPSLDYRKQVSILITADDAQFRVKRPPVKMNKASCCKKVSRLFVRINLPLFSTVVPAVVFFCPVGLSLL